MYGLFRVAGCFAFLLFCATAALAADGGQNAPTDEVKTAKVAEKEIERSEPSTLKKIASGKSKGEHAAIEKIKKDASSTTIAPKNIVVDYSAFVKAVEPKVVKIAVTSSDGSKVTGSGFFVNASGVLATNAHVVQGAATGLVLFSDGHREKLSGTYILDDEHDVALIQVEGYGKKKSPFLLLGSTSSLSAGMPVVAFGSPEGLTNSISTGIVSAVRKEGVRVAGGSVKSLRKSVLQKVIQHTAAISAGSSGSPLMNLQGEVLGINTFVNAAGQNLNFAVPVERLQEHLDNLEFSPSSSVEEHATLHPLGQGAKGKPVFNLLISLGVFLAVAFGVWRLGRSSES